MSEFDLAAHLVGKKVHPKVGSSVELMAVRTVDQLEYLLGSRKVSMKVEQKAVELDEKMVDEMDGM